MECEERVVVLPRDVSRNAARVLLTELAEREHGELARLHRCPGSTRRASLRQRVVALVRPL